MQGKDAEQTTGELGVTWTGCATVNPTTHLQVPESAYGLPSPKIPLRGGGNVLDLDLVLETSQTTQKYSATFQTSEMILRTTQKYSKLRSFDHQTSNTTLFEKAPGTFD